MKQKRQGRQRALVNTMNLKKEPEECVLVCHRCVLYRGQALYEQLHQDGEEGYLCADLVGAQLYPGTTHSYQALWYS